MCYRAIGATVVLTMVSFFVVSGTALAAVPAVGHAPTSVTVLKAGVGGGPPGSCDGDAHPEGRCGSEAPAPKPRKPGSDNG